MNVASEPAFALYRRLIILSGLVVFITITVTARPALAQSGLLYTLIVFIAFQVFFPLLQENRTALISVIALGGGLYAGPVALAWIVALGVFAGYLLLYWWPSSLFRRPPSLRACLEQAAVVASHNIIPLVVALSLPGLTTRLTAGPSNLGYWPLFLVISLVFAGLHGLLFLGTGLLHPARAGGGFRRTLVSLVLIELLPLPFVYLLVTALPVFQIGSLLALGALPTVFAVLLHGLNLARNNLERRLQDLSTLNKISRALRSTLDLDSLLTVIHLQVTQLLGVDNFYVALYNLEEERLWYPLAVKYGQRQNWPPRSLTDRLTDRVIRESKPILLAHHAQQQLIQIGLPSGENAPSAWIGVPLITSERAIGCLALFSFSPAVEFYQSDLDLLTILSGQASVAIENALLYEQAQKRSVQLETLNRLTGLITASLNPQDVLGQVCNSVAQVAGGARSVIFLLDPEAGQVWLAHAHGLSDQFASQNAAFSLVHDTRTRCLRTGMPVIVPDLADAPLDRNYIQSLTQEGIHAFGDFPLTTPDGQIGYLSVFYNTAHSFHADETELLQTLASQAALAVANARLHARTDMALARRAHQLSMLEAVGRELAAAISSDRLFDLIVNYAIEFTNSNWGNIRLLDHASNTLVARVAHGYFIAIPSLAADQGITGRCISTRRAINVGDVTKDPDYVGFTNNQSRSQLSVPLTHEERVLGVLTVESTLVNAFTAYDQSFLSQLANQAAIAVVNAQLYRESQQRLREQSILYLVTTRLAGSLEMESVLQAVARAMVSAIRTVVVGIYLWDSDAAVYTLKVTETTVPHPPLFPEIAGQSIDNLHRALQDNLPFRLLPHSPEWQTLSGDCQPCHGLVLPLVAAGQVLGMLILHLYPDQSVTDDELQLLRAIVAQGAISLQNALLFADVSVGRDRLAAVLNSVGEGIMLIESTGRVTLVNESMLKLTGLTLETIAGKRLASLPLEVLQVFGYQQSTEVTALVEFLGQEKVVPPPKSIFPLQDSRTARVLERFHAPVWGQGDRVIGWLIILRDVTEEKQVNQTRELLTETLVHDLRSPISAVIGALDMLGEALVNQGDEEYRRQALRVARRGAGRVLNLVDSLLEIGRLQTGTLKLSPTFIQLDLLVAQTIAEFWFQVSDFGIRLENTVSADLPPIQADQGKIARVLINLVDNAVKFSPDGGKVVISACLAQNDQIAISVTDDGPGIPQEFREKIFDRFAQIPGQHGRRRGAGLGLTFCRLAVEAHGGRIWVESGPSAGSAFVFTLPVAGLPLLQQ